MNSSLPSPGEASKPKLLGQIRQLPRLCSYSLHTMVRTHVVIATMIGALLPVGSAYAQVNVEQIVAQKVQPILPKGGRGGVAVAVRMNGNTQFIRTATATPPLPPFGKRFNPYCQRVGEEALRSLFG